MSNAKVVGIIQVSINGETNSDIANVKIVGLDGSVRLATYNGLIYEGEQIVSDDAEVLFQVKYLALKTAIVYEGVFTVLSDSSVTTKALKQNNELDLDNIETAAGDSLQSSSSVIDESSDFVTTPTVLDLNRGEDGEFGLGIIEATASTFTAIDGTVQTNPTDSTPPVISSSNVVVFDENSEDIVIQVLSGDENSVTYSLEADFDSALFSIDAVTGVISFLSSPDYENPLDVGVDNEYNIYVTATDSLGNFTTQSLSININNLNEAPIANDDIAASSENETIIIDVLSNDTDVDTPDTMTITNATLAEGQGSITIVNNQLEFNPGTDFDDLSLGDVTTVEISYTISDEGGLTSNATVTLTVTGTNDVPVLSVVDIAATEDGTEVTGTASFTDLDIANTHTYSVSTMTVGEGSVSIAQDGVYTYAIDSDFQGLALGETQDVTFNVTVTDNNGASDTQSVTVTVTGTNDQPVVNAIDLNGSSNLLGTVTGTILSDTDTITTNGEGSVAYTRFTVYQTTIVTLRTDGPTIDPVLYLFEENNFTSGNEIAFDDDSGTSAGSFSNSTITITLEPGDYIAAFSDYSFSSAEAVSGFNNNGLTGDVTLNFTSDNDITIYDSSNTETLVSETNAIETIASGQLTLASDLDSTDTHTFAQAGIAAVVTNGTSTAEVTDLSVLVAADGIYTITANFDALANGETATVTFDYTATDDSGALNAQSELKTVTLTITGTNDQPIVLDISATQTEVDDVNAAYELNTFTDTLDVTDLDVTDTHSFEVVDGTLFIISNVGVDVQTVEIVQDESGVWSYNVVGDFNALSEGESATVTFDYVAIDDSGASTDTSDIKTITLTINGTTDQEVVDLLNDTQAAVDALIATSITSGADANLANATADTVFSIAQAAQTAIDATDTQIANQTLTDAESAGQVAIDATNIALTDATTAVGDATTALAAANAAVTQAQAQTSDITTVNAALTVAQASVATATTVLASAETELVDAQQQLFDATTLSTEIETATDAIVTDDNTTSTDATTATTTAQNMANTAASATTSAQTTADSAQAIANSARVATINAAGTDDSASDLTAEDLLVIAKDATTQYVADATTLVANADASVIAADAVLTAADNAVVQVQDALNSANAANEDNTAQTIALSNAQAAQIVATTSVTDAGAAKVVADAELVDANTLNTSVNNIGDAIDGTNSVIEDAQGSTTGNVVTNDSNIDSVTAQTFAGTYGTLSLDVNGDYTYTLNNTDVNVQALGEGEVVTDVFTYDTLDLDGNADSAQISLNITGINDKPVITEAVSLAQISESDMNDFNSSLADFSYVVSQAEVLAAANITDADSNDTHSVELYNTTYILEFNTNTANRPANPFDNKLYGGVLTITQQHVDDLATELNIDSTNIGDFLIYGDGLNKLGAGETGTFTFYVSANDGTTGANNGESNTSDWQAVTITIEGTNDQPTVTDIVVNAVSEEAAETVGSQIIHTGDLEVTDVDTNDAHTFTVSTPIAATNPVANLAVTITDAETGAYTVEGDFDYLAVGETETVTFSYIATDSEGSASDAKTVTLTVTGTNDQPEIGDVVVAAGIFESEFTDANTNLVYSSTTDLVAADLDTTDISTMSQSNFAGSYGQSEVGLQVSLVQSDATFMAVYQAASGGDANALTMLKAALVEIMTSPLISGVVGSSTTLTTLVSNILSASSVADIENVINTTTGLAITSTPTDVTLMAEATPTQTTILEDLGILVIDVDASGSYTLTSPLVNSLAEGEVVNITFGYVATDDSGAANAVSDVKNVTLNITGINDKPVITEAVSLAQISESDMNDFNSSLADFSYVVSQAEVLAAANITDADSNDTHSVELYNTTYILEFNTNTANRPANPFDNKLYGGVLTITQQHVDDLATELNIDSTNIGDFLIYGDGLNKLGAGETGTFTFYVSANDGTTGANNGESNTSDWQAVTITIEGTNDQPTVTDIVVNAVSEEAAETVGSQIIHTGDLEVTDVDTNDAHTFTVSTPIAATNPVANLAVTITDAETGAYTVEGDFDYLAVGETETVTFSYIATDSEGSASDAKTVTLTVTGTNDQPEIGDVVVAAGIFESEFTDANTNLVYSSTTDLVAADLDTTDISTMSQSNFAGSYGQSEVGLQVSLVQSDATFMAVYQAASGGDANALTMLKAALVEIMTSPLISGVVGSSTTLTTLVSNILSASSVADIENVINTTTGLAITSTPTDVTLISALVIIAKFTPFSLILRLVISSSNAPITKSGVW
ncbi:VCBS domain-containing protein [Sulfurimonas sp. SAG-AH-194-L11]|nr:VCBS domain-containing protein [Sulfurimonas sp. SAG-AH-194-L11]MDF1877873.1 VCBS domain-containing protein [Sulfurimonas sp. SAG-AH-194-L11]